jgi:hypothetical protein
LAQAGVATNFFEVKTGHSPNRVTPKMSPESGQIWKGSLGLLRSNLDVAPDSNCILL